MKTSDSSYRVYIVRSWQEQTSEADVPARRFVLEVPWTGARIGYKSLDALWLRLQKELLATQTSPQINKQPPNK